MTPDDAIKRLIFHAEPEPGAFLDMLRPYSGLRDEVLIDLKTSLRAAAPRFAEQHLPRELVSALWELLYCGWLWALVPGGMLRRNHLISDADRKRLEDFLENFGMAVTMLLQGSFEEAFADWRTDP
jgi:hypothetical protein